MERRYWVVRLGGGGHYVDVLEEKNQIAIGWDDLNNLTYLIDENMDDDKLYQRLHDKYEKIYNGSSVAVGVNVGQVWNFIVEMDNEDIVLIPTPHRQILIGEVDTDYEFKKDWEDECHYPHRRIVNWLKKIDRDDLPEPLKASLTSHLTVFNIDKHGRLIENLLGKKIKVEKLDKSGEELVKEIIRRLMIFSPREFELFISHLLEIIGFSTMTTEYVGDKGIDIIGVLNAESLTNINLKVQVRRVKSTIGIKEIQRMRGTLALDDHGAIITTSGFSNQAIQEAEADNMKPITLIDGETLVDMILKLYSKLDEKYKSIIQLQAKEIPLRDRFTITIEG